MRAVADTNVWLRALIRRSSYAGQVLDAWLAGRFTLVASEPLLAELADVLSRPRIRNKYKIAQADVDQLLGAMPLLADMVVIPGTLRLCRDPKDDMFIETALIGHAEVIVSQDKDLLGAPIPTISVLESSEGSDPVGREIPRVQVMTASQFLVRLDAPA